MAKEVPEDVLWGGSLLKNHTETINLLPHPSQMLKDMEDVWVPLTWVESEPQDGIKVDVPASITNPQGSSAAYMAQLVSLL